MTKLELAKFRWLNNAVVHASRKLCLISWITIEKTKQQIARSKALLAKK